MEITRGRIQCGQKVIIYGPEGIGKTTLAAQFPNPVFIDTEGSTKNFDVARLPVPTSWEMLKQEAEYPLQNPGQIGSLIIDTADWAEKMCNKCVFQRADKTGIEDFGYGKGYVYAAEEFGRLLDILDRVTSAGVHAIITAHSNLRKVEQPDEMTSYDRWELKCSKQLSPMLKEWADMVLFCNYKTIVIKTDDKANKGKAQGGKRVMYATHHTCWDAKNRYGLPDEMPMDYGHIAHIFGSPSSAPDMGIPVTANPIHAGSTIARGPDPTVPYPTAAPTSNNAPAPTTAPAQEQADLSAAQMPPENPTPAATNEVPAALATATPVAAPGVPMDEPPFVFGNTLHGIYPPFADLLRENEVMPAEIQLVVNERGYFPVDMPVQNYPQDFIEGVLIGAWDSVFESVKADRAALPF